MAKEQTLSIIKPDGVSRNIIGKLLSRFESNGLQVVAMKMIHLSKKEAEGFYAVHQRRPFFGGLTDYMSSGPVIAQVLEGEMRLPKTGKSWEPPILKKQRKGPFAKTMRSISSKTPCMDPMLPNQLPAKSPISFHIWNWSILPEFQSEWRFIDTPPQLITSRASRRPFISPMSPR